MSTYRLSSLRSERFKPRRSNSPTAAARVGILILKAPVADLFKLLTTRARATGASAMLTLCRSGVSDFAMLQSASVTLAAATSFRPRRKPSAFGRVNEAAPRAKANGMARKAP